jgi:transcriptional regulator with XRE-family HTH domain
MNESLSQISPKKLAEAIGVSEGFAWQIKSGRRKLPSKYLRLVSEKFSIPMSVLRPDLASVLETPAP